MIRVEAEVATECQTIQQILTEHGGELDRLDRTESSHLEVCPDCRGVAAAERAMRLLFAEAIPPADPTVEERVRAALRPARIRRRVVAFLPVAASLIMALVGAVMIGGVPASGVLGLLPEFSAQGWMAFASSVSDWSTAVATGARAAATTLDPAFLAVAGVVSIFGLVGLVATALRWRRVSLWRDHR